MDAGKASYHKAAKSLINYISGDPSETDHQNGE